MATAASAAASLSVSPDTGLTNGQSVTVSGSGFTASSAGAMLECNNDPSQPTVEVAGIEQAPVGCTNPLLKIVSTNASGAVPSTSFTVATGTIGPPAAGTDSAGHDAATDAALYPCPPTAAQVTAGDTCVVAYGTQGGAEVQHPISFSSGGGGTTTTTTSGGGTTTTTTSGGATTTTTTSGSASTTSSTTTTTTQPCDAKDTTSTGSGPVLTASPGTCVNGGTVVTLKGTGFSKGGSGTVLECNSDTGQPTVSLPAPVSQDVPVSCSGINTNHLVTVGADGTFTTTFTIISPTPGPPCGPAYALTPTCPTSDNAAHVKGHATAHADPATDAAAYPCPPTAAQLAAGDTCTLSFGDSGGDQATVNISFVPNPTPSTGATTASSTSSSGGTTATTVAGTATASTAAKASSLAFTGAGPDTWYMLLAGVLLLNAGFLVLTLYYRPRELMAMMRRGVSQTFGGR